ncbi:hypothetical protein GO291_04984 [Ralstonia solanacearum]|nr:hypothetical protein [Ralstonia solanacearum]
MMMKRQTSLAKAAHAGKPWATRDSVQNSRKRGQSKEGSQRWMNP